MKIKAILRITAYLLLLGILLDLGSECYVPYEMQTASDFQSIKIGEASRPSVGHFLLSRLNEGEGEYQRNSLHANDILISRGSAFTRNQIYIDNCTVVVRSSELFSSTSIILLEHRFRI
ncbi:MAG TPA: hypothetical protein PLR06_04525 [Cyclobacteriaceae bacterium]|nr:hypothetical protein [Cyclobacteriaceae bacterium]